MIQRLPDAPGVGQDGAGAAAYVKPEIDVLLLGRTAMVRRQLAQQIGQLQRLTVDRERTSLALAEIEHGVDLPGQALDRLEDRVDIIARLRLQFTGHAGRQHLGKSLNGCQRRAKFIAHVRQEAALDGVGLGQGFIAFAQRPLDPLAVRHIEHGKQRVAVRQRHGGKAEMAAIGKAHFAVTPRTFLCRRAHSLAHDRGLGGIVQLAGNGGDQLVDMGMAGQRLVVRLPDFGKPLIPQVQTAVRCEHGDAFEQIVERGGAHPQQGIPRAGEPGLLGPVLEDQQQPPIRRWLGDDAQMGAISQQPVFLDRLGRAKPLLALGPPRAEVAHLRQALGIAHTVQHA